jgi:hypothetical protein
MAGPIDWDTLLIGPCMNAFAEPVTYTPAGGAPYQITGVFDRAYLEQLPFGGGGGQEPLGFGSAGNITAARPVLGVQLSQFAQEPAQDDTVLIPSVGIAYTVKEVQPDGHGWALLLLSTGTD